MKNKTRRPWGRIILITLSVLVVAAVIAGLRIRKQLSPDLVQDIRAGIAARNVKDPDARLEKYLEGRYGPQDDPANRQKVFVNMFNPEHIKSMQFLVDHSPESQRKANVQAMAKWVENYRNTLTPETTVALKTQILSSDGQAMLRMATAHYNNQDVYYRGMTAPVVSQLLTTISQLQKN